MQLRGWGPTQAARIVIILVVVQYLGLGQILAFAPVATAGFTNTGRSQAIAAFDAAVPLGDRVPRELAIERGPRGVRLSGQPCLNAAPLPRRLPRAPPAV